MLYLQVGARHASPLHRKLQRESSHEQDILLLVWCCRNYFCTLASAHVLHPLWEIQRVCYSHRIFDVLHCRRLGRLDFDFLFESSRHVKRLVVSDDCFHPGVSSGDDFHARRWHVRIHRHFDLPADSVVHIHMVRVNRRQVSCEAMTKKERMHASALFIS